MMRGNPATVWGSGPLTLVVTVGAIDQMRGLAKGSLSLSGVCSYRRVDGHYNCASEDTGSCVREETLGSLRVHQGDFTLASFRLRSTV